jgi:hypothetical protein
MPYGVVLHQQCSDRIRKDFLSRHARGLTGQVKVRQTRTRFVGVSLMLALQLLTYAKNDGYYLLRKFFWGVKLIPSMKLF